MTPPRPPRVTQLAGGRVPETCSSHTRGQGLPYGGGGEGRSQISASGQEKGTGTRTCSVLPVGLGLRGVLCECRPQVVDAERGRAAGEGNGALLFQRGAVPLGPALEPGHSFAKQKPAFPRASLNYISPPQRNVVPCYFLTRETCCLLHLLRVQVPMHSNGTYFFGSLLFSR